MPSQGRLKIHGHGDVEVRIVAALLGELDRAYGSIVVFDAEIDAIRRDLRGFGLTTSPVAFETQWLYSRRRVSIALDWPPSSEAVASLVPITERLILSSVKLTSPGFWEFFGSLNPLEVMRQYLNDRHERRKDRSYRESAEQRRLALENMSLENRVLSERLQIANDAGLSPRDIAHLLNGLVYDPLLSLDKFQDGEVIEGAEIVED